MGYYDDLKPATNYSCTSNDEPLSVWAWVGILIVLAIPVINLIALLIMVFTENKNLSNFAKASLLLVVIPFAFAILLGGCNAL